MKPLLFIFPILMISCSKDLDSCDSSLTLTNTETNLSTSSCANNSSGIRGQMEFRFSFDREEYTNVEASNAFNDSGESLGLEISFDQDTRQLLFVILSVSESLAENVRVNGNRPIRHKFDCLELNSPHIDFTIIELETHFEADIFLSTDDYRVDTKLYSVDPIF